MAPAELSTETDQEADVGEFPEFQCNFCSVQAVVGSLQAMKAPAAFFASAELPESSSRCADEPSAPLPTSAPAWHVQLLRMLSRS